MLGLQLGFQVFGEAAQLENFADGFRHLRKPVVFVRKPDHAGFEVDANSIALLNSGAEVGTFHGVDAFKYKLMKPFYAAFPDYYAKNDIEVADENMVSATGFLTCTHRGEWLGLPPTGKPVRMRFSDFWLVRDGRLAENWVMIDHLDVMRQLGVDLLRNVK